MKKNAFALASLLVGIASFIQLLGIEKAVLAVVFGVFALGEAQKSPEIGGKGRAYAGVILGIAYLVTVIAVIAIKGPEIISHFRSIPK